MLVTSFDQRVEQFQALDSFWTSINVLHPPIYGNSFHQRIICRLASTLVKHIAKSTRRDGHRTEHRQQTPIKMIYPPTKNGNFHPSSAPHNFLPKRNPKIYSNGCSRFDGIRYDAYGLGRDVLIERGLFAIAIPRPSTLPIVGEIKGHISSRGRFMYDNGLRK